LREEQEVRLVSWSEIVGTYNGLVIAEHFTRVRINGNIISFPNGTEEATLLQQFLNESMVGRRVGVLRADLPDKPLLIRLIG